MNRSIVVLALVALAAPLAVLAAPAEDAAGYVETVVIKAPVSKVWATIKNFDSLNSLASGVRQRRDHQGHE
jgi:hypothetical protein